jgi:uncharacterized membrane protein YraQ (UPF0718 family)
VVDIGGYDTAATLSAQLEAAPCAAFWLYGTLLLLLLLLLLLKVLRLRENRSANHDSM